MRRPFLLIAHDQDKTDAPDTERLPVEGFEAKFLPPITAKGKDGGYQCSAEWSLIFRFQVNGFVVSMN